MYRLTSFHHLLIHTRLRRDTDNFLVCRSTLLQKAKLPLYRLYNNQFLLVDTHQHLKCKIVSIVFCLIYRMRLKMASASRRSFQFGTDQKM